MVFEAALNTIAGRRFLVEQEDGRCAARLRSLGSAVALAQGMARESPPGLVWRVVEQRRRRRRGVVWRSAGEGGDALGALVPSGPPRGPLRSDAVALERPPDEDPPDAVAATG